MLKRLTTATLFTFIATLAFCDDPDVTEPIGVPPAVCVAPFRVSHLNAFPANAVFQNGITNFFASAVSTKLADGKHIFVLSGNPQIDHSGQSNGSFTVSANTISLSMPADAIANPGSVSLDDLDATGACNFNAGPLRITSQRIVMRTDQQAGQSTLAFSGDVLIATNGLTATADSISLTRTGEDWTLSGTLVAPKDGE